MNAWWNTRSPREKALLGIAGLLLAVAAIWQLVLQPAIHTLDRAKLNHEKGTQTLARLDRIEALIQQGQTLHPVITAPATQDAAALQAQAAQMARQAELSVETPPASQSSFQVRLTGITSPVFFQWVEQVETGLGVTVSAATLKQNADGSMDASAEFSLGKRP